MAETIYTPDGKTHVLVGSTTLESIIREYCGDESADIVQRLQENNAYEEARANTDLGAYEEELSTLHRYMQDWVDDLKALAKSTENKKFTKRCIAEYLLRIASAIEIEL